MSVNIRCFPLIVPGTSMAVILSVYHNRLLYQGQECRTFVNEKHPRIILASTYTLSSEFKTIFNPINNLQILQISDKHKLMNKLYYLLPIFLALRTFSSFLLEKKQILALLMPASAG